MTQLEVLLPFYGDPDLMKAAVRSVLAQDCTTWRLTVVDDCYPDPSIPEWFDGLDDPRVTYHRNDANLGVSGNFARALELAEGDYVVFLGCDDLLLPHYVSSIRGAVDTYPDTTIIATEVEVIDADGLVVDPLADRVKRALSPRPLGHVMGGERLLGSLLRGNWTYFPNLAWHRPTVLEYGFNETYEVVPDLALLVDLIRNGGTMVVVPGTHFQYRRHPASVSALRALSGERFREERAYFREARRSLLAQGQRRAARAARWHLSSRLHALALVPRSVTSTGEREVVIDLLRHVVG
ncbi:glycosyltransferase [Nocardioides terrisoli]|uniref:glycosyltransferase n=1 Tax=Nocardioides terrisoli TaxID=3388267 RepID=UPI00287BB5E4|nr:glycosyltransferase [Nocardioides marmorisolisilvae]